MGIKIASWPPNSKISVQNWQNKLLVDFIMSTYISFPDTSMQFSWYVGNIYSFINQTTPVSPLQESKMAAKIQYSNSV